MLTYIATCGQHLLHSRWPSSSALPDHGWSLREQEQTALGMPTWALPIQHSRNEHMVVHGTRGGCHRDYGCYGRRAAISQSGRKPVKYVLMETGWIVMKGHGLYERLTVSLAVREMASAPALSFAIE